jgi:hypothetical protein
LILFFILISSVNAQTITPTDVGIDIQVIYHGVQMKNSEFQKVQKETLYCGLILTEVIVKRGYFDGRVDKTACFDTQAEVAQNDALNSAIIGRFGQGSSRSIYSVSGIQVGIQSNGCDTQNRGTGFRTNLYGESYGDVCNSWRQVGLPLQGTHQIDSVWLVGGTCAKITLHQKLPSGTWVHIGVDFSSAFYNQSYIQQYQWTPKC